MLQTIRDRSGSPKPSQSSKAQSESNEAHIKEILDSAEKWISQQLLFHEYVTAFDLLEHFDVDPKLARMLITRFEKRTSTYAIYPLSLNSTIPRSSLQPLEQILASNYNKNTNHREEYHVHSNNSSPLSIPNNHSDENGHHLLSLHDGGNNQRDKPLYLLEPNNSDLPMFSPSVSPKIYSNPYDYIDYNKTKFDTWFSSEKHKYIIAIQESSASHGIGLPEFIAEMIVISSVLLPGCYTLTGLLFPPSRNEADLFAEYANKETGYITNKTDKGIAYKRKKPMVNVRRPENNTASLWLDEDGSICGFRCIWVHGLRGKLMVDQKFCVLNGCWTLTGEITITFEQWDVEDEFEGYLETETFCGRWTAGKELYGEFQWFITTIESFYLSHNIPDNIMNSNSNKENTLSPNDNHQQIVFHDSMGVSMEDEFDLEDDSMTNFNGNNANNHNYNVLYNKIFDIEINESLTITAKFLKRENVLEISEKQDIADIDDENEIIGHGKWYRNGKMSFENVKYIDQKLLLSFDGCCDGKKVLGRLCIYHDNTSSINSLKQKSFMTDSSSPKKHSSALSDEEIDDDDEEDFFGGVLSQVTGDELDEDEDDDDDDERISFIQMIIVSNIVPA